MPIMAKSNDEYTEVKSLKKADGTEIDYVLSKVGNEYKRTYTAVRELEDSPPLEFKSIKPNANLIDYRIYGQTSRNLCNNIWEQKMINASTGNAVDNSSCVCCDFIPVTPNAVYSLSRTQAQFYNNLRCYDINKTYLGTGETCADKSNPLGNWERFGTLTITNANVAFIRFNDMSNSLDTKYMLVKGVYTSDTMLPYEPYGESVGDLVTSGEHAGEYKVSATISNGTDTITTPIYIPEQIKKVGDEAEYIDYEEQKFHRISGADLDVTLPSLPTVTGTNVLSVGTEVQPSDMYIKGNFKMIAGGANNGD